jgi:hypothetical protein
MIILGGVAVLGVLVFLAMIAVVLTGGGDADTDTASETAVLDPPDDDTTFGEEGSAVVGTLKSRSKGEGAGDSGVPKIDSVEPVAVSEEPLPELHYRWQEGERYAYNMGLRATMRGVICEIEGTSTFTVRPPTEFAKWEEAIGASTGSAFVVSSDGYLVSCAHCVEGTNKLEVHLGDRTFQGQVVATDAKNDLALIRVPARGLPVVPLADSGRVQLAEEVRAVGYPHSDILGASVKVTQGSVSGILKDEETNLFQVDAAVNPGNSGGPLINERGEVIAVVTAKLIGEQYADIAFGIPVNEAKRVLSAQGVRFTESRASEKLEGPELARRVTPAVAFLVGQMGPGSRGKGQLFTLDFSGEFQTTIRPRVVTRSSPPPSTSSEKSSGQILVDQFGRILDVHGPAGAPPLFCPFGQSIVVQLSPEGKQHWSARETTLVPAVEKKSASFESPFGLRGRSYSRYPRAPAPANVTVVTIQRATESATYTVDESADGRTVISKDYILRSMGQLDGRPQYTVSGVGKTTFDKILGLPTAMEFGGRVTPYVDRSLPAATIRIAFCQADLDTPVLSLLDEITEGTLPKLNAAAAAIAEMDVDQLLAALETADSGSHDERNIVSQLRIRKPVEERREAVTAALNSVFEGGDPSTAREAREALLTWGTDEAILALGDKYYRDFWGDSRDRLSARLAKIDRQEAAEILVKYVVLLGDRDALAPLKDMGPVAEAPVITLLANSDRHVRIEACGILGKIGTRESYTALTAFLKHERDATVWQMANAALSKIKADKRHYASQPAKPEG